MTCSGEGVEIQRGNRVGDKTPNIPREASRGAKAGTATTDRAHKDGRSSSYLSYTYHLPRAFLPRRLLGEHMREATTVVTPARYEQGLTYTDFLAQAKVNV